MTCVPVSHSRQMSGVTNIGSVAGAGVASVPGAPMTVTPALIAAADRSISSLPSISARDITSEYLSDAGRREGLFAFLNLTDDNDNDPDKVPDLATAVLWRSCVMQEVLIVAQALRCTVAAALMTSSDPPIACASLAHFTTRVEQGDICALANLEHELGPVLWRLYGAILLAQLGDANVAAFRVLCAAVMARPPMPHEMLQCLAERHHQALSAVTDGPSVQMQVFAPLAGPDAVLVTSNLMALRQICSTYAASVTPLRMADGSWVMTAARAPLRMQPASVEDNPRAPSPQRLSPHQQSPPHQQSQPVEQPQQSERPHQLHLVDDEPPQQLLSPQQERVEQLPREGNLVGSRPDGSTGDDAAPSGLHRCAAKAPAAQFRLRISSPLPTPPSSPGPDHELDEGAPDDLVDAIGRRSSSGSSSEAGESDVEASGAGGGESTGGGSGSVAELTAVRAKTVSPFIIRRPTQSTAVAVLGHTGLTVTLPGVHSVVRGGACDSTANDLSVLAATAGAAVGRVFEDQPFQAFVAAQFHKAAMTVSPSLCALGGLYREAAGQLDDIPPTELNYMAKLRPPSISTASRASGELLLHDAAGIRELMEAVAHNGGPLVSDDRDPQVVLAKLNELYAFLQRAFQLLGLYEFVFEPGRHARRKSGVSKDVIWTKSLANATGPGVALVGLRQAKKYIDVAKFVLKYPALMVQTELRRLSDFFPKWQNRSGFMVERRIMDVAQAATSMEHWRGIESACTAFGDLNGQVPAGHDARERLQFSLVTVPGLGDCGFLALDATREGCVAALMAALNGGGKVALLLCEMLGTELETVLVEGEPLPTGIIDEQLDDICARLAASQASLDAQEALARTTGQPMTQQQHAMALASVAAALTERRNWCRLVGSCARYVARYYGGVERRPVQYSVGKNAPGILNALAQVLRLEVHVWTRNALEPKSRTLTHLRAIGGASVSDRAAAELDAPRAMELSDDEDNGSGGLLLLGNGCDDTNHQSMGDPSDYDLLDTRALLLESHAFRLELGDMDMFANFERLVSAGSLSSGEMSASAPLAVHVLHDGAHFDRLIPTSRLSPTADTLRAVESALRLSAHYSPPPPPSSESCFDFAEITSSAARAGGPSTQKRAKSTDMSGMDTGGVVAGTTLRRNLQQRGGRK